MGWGDYSFCLIVTILGSSFRCFHSWSHAKQNFLPQSTHPSSGIWSGWSHTMLFLCSLLRLQWDIMWPPTLQQQQHGKVWRSNIEACVLEDRGNKEGSETILWWSEFPRIPQIETNQCFTFIPRPDSVKVGGNWSYHWDPTISRDRTKIKQVPFDPYDFSHLPRPLLINSC